MRLELFSVTSRISALARAGRISCARRLFDQMPQRDSVSWNAMISGYAQLGLHQEALFLFRSMRSAGAWPDHFTLTATLAACAGSNDLVYGTKVHALVILLGFQSYLPVNNSLIDMYGKCLCPNSASKVFEAMSFTNEITWCSLLFAHVNCGNFGAANDLFVLLPERVQIAWNIMIAGCGRWGDVESCFGLFKDMQVSGSEPDQWTLSSLMNACSESLEHFHGRMVHAYIIKSGWGIAVESKNSILSFYSKLCCVEDVMKLLKSFGTLTLVSSNVIIDAHMKIGDTDKAFLEFQRIPEKNIVSWTSMITGYARNGHGEQALSFFVDMIKNCHKPDDLAFGAVLHACSILAVLGQGEMIHGCIICSGFLGKAYVGNGLVNMYAKCGHIEASSHAFYDIASKDVVSWNAMLFGFGLHGQAKEALQLFKEMVASGTKPDKVTFIGMLMTCSHSGLLEKGGKLFNSMDLEYGVAHEMDHVACMIDMLGRGGYLAEARELTEETRGTTTMWDALLGACSAHVDMEIGTYSGEGLKKRDPHNEMSYVVLSNLYCASGKWKEAETVRRVMNSQGVRKTPGCSWIEVRNVVTAFVAGNNPHPLMEDLREMLRFLDFETRSSRISVSD
ncbi:pentatricopeptide repeat-containing protein At2g36980, mitochondrial [Rhodamnia argentea]|uniref:Pentatricopeptide repeat-containing protein At2g36980, mitochondrial n=1 Tax=Rhodamnia argentea TaxID=178133 RepID=A0A8B8QME1_9MYRT|nr:pentatricopeptide repeat-containing protein At2g36980, mitochondrial [Rhodamnia argentea]